MDLFVINRYTGDNIENQENPNEEELKKELIRKINQRKRLSEIDGSNESTYKKKKKKEYTENDHETDCKAIEETTTTKDKKKATEDFEKDNTNKDDESKVTTDEVDECLDKNEKESVGFTLLGDAHMTKKEKVKRKLPDWLANPSVVSVDLKNLKCTVDSIPELDRIFVNKLVENGITHFFPVQSQIIPWILQVADRPHKYWPNDICVSAPTGSGKTLGFVLPILQLLHKRIVPRIRALVVLPVQDLANQVYKVFEIYSEPTNLKIILLSKKRSFEEEQSLIRKDDGTGKYRTLVDIIVTTPGRLVDHLTKTKGLYLGDLLYLVIDEADRIMENIQNDWLYHLNKHINSECTRSYQMPVITYNSMVTRKRPPNKLLFSATLSQDPEKIQQLGLFLPKLFSSVVNSDNEKTNGVKDDGKFIGKYTTPAELTEYYANATKIDKPLIVHHLLKTGLWKNVLCFVNSAEATSRLAFILKALSKKKIKVSSLSSNLTIRKRDAVLQKFSNGELDVLISSDTLARGIDIPNVHCVISYDNPKYVKTYVHRIGRTGRAGKEGSSLVLLSSKEVNNFNKMIETAGKSSVQELKIDAKELDVYRESYEKALKKLETILEKKQENILFKVKAKKKLQKKITKGDLGKKFSKKK